MSNVHGVLILFIDKQKPIMKRTRGFILFILYLLTYFDNNVQSSSNILNFKIWLFITWDYLAVSICLSLEESWHNLGIHCLLPWSNALSPKSIELVLFPCEPCHDQQMHSKKPILHPQLCSHPWLQEYRHLQKGFEYYWIYYWIELLKSRSVEA